MLLLLKVLAFAGVCGDRVASVVPIFLLMTIRTVGRR